MGAGASQPGNGTFILHIALGGCLHGGEINYGITEDTGGHIAYVLGAARAQAKRSDVSRVDIVTRGFDDRGLGEIHAAPREIYCAKGSIHRLRSARSDYLEKSDLEAELPALRMAFLELLERLPRPDVIHAHFADGAALAIAAEERFGVPWVYTAHSLGLDKPGTAEGPRIARERAAIDQAGAIIASSRDEAERQIVAYNLDAAGRVHHVRPGVTLAPACGLRPAQALIEPLLADPQKPIVLAVARPVRKKNLSGLVEAFASSPDLQAKANLVILSGQHNRLRAEGCEATDVIADIKRLVLRHRLSGLVALPPAHRPEHVRSLFELASASGVFVNPAFVEPFGLTTLEALQSGCPVVATRHGGPAGVLAKVGYGQVVNPYDPTEIAAACLKLLADPKRHKRAEAARTRTRALFDWTRWAERSAMIYGELRRSATREPVAERLVVSDIDGTLTGDRTAARQIKPFLATLRRSKLVVATGRSISEARRVLSDWDLPQPETIIASVGTEIWHHRGQGAYQLDDSYAAKLDPGWTIGAITAMARNLGLVPQPAYDQRRWKASFFGTAADAAELRGSLIRAGQFARVIPSHGNLIDVIPVMAGKAAAMGHVAARYGLGLSDCIACGDSGNDADMLEAAGVAILPSNALGEIDHITGPHVVRANAPHAAGVIEGLQQTLGLANRSAMAAE